jgi:hypothetical protein
MASSRGLGKKAAAGLPFSFDRMPTHSARWRRQKGEAIQPAAQQISVIERF